MKYAAFFRGINVGGKNIVKMADLKQLLVELGLKNVQTYIQSGNAVFETRLGEAALVEKIEAGFSERFGFDSNVIVRSEDELGAMVHNLPFSANEKSTAQNADPQVEHLYVYFLDEPRQAAFGSDRMQPGQRELYVLLRRSIRQSKLAACLSKVFHTATVRNWKTVSKLYGLMTDISSIVH